MSKPLVSVITVVYNGAATLETTLLSVIGQSYDRIEYILVDGGSKDGTLDLIDRHKSHIATWVSEPDSGVYDAMNKGIRMAKGEWLFFLGSDDRFQDDDVLTSIFADPSNLEYDLLYGDVTSPSYKGLYDGPFTFEKVLSRNISHQAIFYRRRIFDRVGDYNLRYKMHADWDLNIRCFKNSYITTKWVGRHIADFGPEGISSGHDIRFIQEVLIPERLRLLNRSGNKALRSLTAYDEWWRLLRNAQIADITALQEYAKGEKIPAAIRRMLKWQHRLPRKLLRTGVFSKMIMFVHYCTNF